MKAEFIDMMGDDLAVVNAARVSFDKESEWEWVERGSDFSYDTLSEKDQKLITYLATHNHWTPFSHVVIKMRETVPIFVARQRFKHVVGFTYNEVSRRYVSDAPTFFTPDEWRKAADNKKQGSSDEIITHIPGYDFFGESYSIADAYSDFIYNAENLYDVMIDAGVAPEQARMILPQSMYTSYIVTGSLAAWARTYKLRTDPHAQKEIQMLAEQWGDIFDSIPSLQYSWKALTQ